MTYTAKPRRSENGAALMLVLGYLAAVTLFASAFLATLHRSLDRSNKEYYTQRCAALAEAGVDKAVAELRRNPAAYAGEQQTPLDEGHFTVTVVAAGRDGAYRIVSAAALEGQQRAMGEVRVTAEILLSGDGAVQTARWERRYERPRK